VSDPELRVISLGLGRQSVAMYLLAAEGKLEPRPDYAIFADTQDESAKTMSWLSRLEDMGEIPIIVATRGKLSGEVIRSMRDTPSGFCPIPTYVQGESREKQGRRQCTRWAKLAVIDREIRQLLNLRPGQRSEPDRAEVWVGISIDEATRAKPSRYPISVNRFPLLYDYPMRRGECAEYVRSRMGDVPPKSSCVYCPFKSDADWIDQKQNDTDSFQRAVEFELELHAIDPTQFLHDSCLPLGEVDFSPDRTLDLFESECEGICGC